MWDRNPTRLSLVHMLPAIAEQWGVPLEPLLGEAGLAADANFARDVIVTRAQICALLLRLARSAGAPTVGLELAAAADPELLGISARALLTGRTLRDCLTGHARNLPDLQGGVGIRLREHDGIACLSHRLLNSDHEHARILNEGIAAFVIRALSAIVGFRPDDISVSLPHRAHAPARIYDERFGARLTFGIGDSLEFSFDARWLDLPNRLFDSAASIEKAVHPYAEPQLTDDVDWRDDEAFIAVIRRRYESASLAGSLSLVDTARSLGISPRTLQRRLAAFGTSFEMELDRWRRGEARRLLADDTLSAGSISRVLGYGHPAHFNRAFWRWEGQTPLAFRRSGRLEMARNGN